jgi:branched-chain amino acid transport system substrate-binding protein
MSNKTWVAVIAIIIILAGVWYYQTQVSAPATGETIKIGVIESLSGSAAYYGEENKKGVEVALDEIRSKYPNLDFQVYHEDSLYTAKGGVDAYTNLQARYDLDAVITHASPVAMAIQPLAKNDGILQMAVSASARQYSSLGDLSFRTSPTTDTEIKVLADFIKSKQYKNIAILYFNNDIGVSVTNSLVDNLANYSGTVVSQEAFVLDTVDYRTYLLKIKQLNPDVVFVAGTAAHLSTILRQASELGVETQFLGFRASEDPLLIKNAGSLAGGFIYTYAFDSLGNDKLTRAFVHAFKNKYDAWPSGYAAEGYEGMKLVAEAFVRCGKNYQCLGNYLSGLKNRASILGPLTFDRSGDVEYPFFLKIVKNGQFIRLEN